MLELSLPRAPVIGAALLLFTAPGSAQDLQELAGPATKPVPQSILQQYHATRGTLQDLKLRANGRSGFEVVVTIDGEGRKLLLQPHDVRAPDFELLVDDGRSLRRIATPASVTYRGLVEGAPDSVVAASLYQGRLDAMIRLQDEVWSIENLQRLDPARPVYQHIVFRGADIVLPADVRCGNQDPHDHDPGVGQGGPPEALKLAEVAIDADLEYYQKNGSNTTTTQNAVTRVINAVDVIYRRDVEITYQVTAIIVRTVRRYSWTGSLSQLLTSFRNNWNSAHGSVKRDLAHLFTGKGSFSGVIGVAYLGVVCNLGSAYGTSKAYHSSLTVNTGLVAHEMGHNWNAGHCSGSGCRIMCAGLGGCSGILTSFGSSSISAITNFRNSRTCLSAACNPPTISSVSTASVQAFDADPVVVTGANLECITSVVMSGLPGSILAQSATSLTIKPPNAPALGAGTLQLIGGAGNTQTPFTWVATDPMKAMVPAFWVGNGFPLEWDFGASPNHTWFLNLAIDNSTINLFGYTFLLNVIPLSQGTLNVVGIGKFSVVPPNLSGLPVYVNVIAVDPSTFTISGVSNIVQTTIF